jgi:ribosomal protein L7/L12
MNPAITVFVVIVVFIIALAVQNASRNADKAMGIIAKFDGLKLTATHLINGGIKYPIAGLTARVEDSGTLNRRITATRLVTLGVFALAAKKKQDDREVYLTIEGDNVQILRTVQFKKAPTAGTAARQFAGQLNLLGRQAAATPAEPAPVPAPEPVSLEAQPRTLGLRAPAQPAVVETPTALYNVVLLNVGDRKIQCIKTIREITPGLGLKEAKDLTEHAPTALALGVDIGYAHQVQALLMSAGAHVVVNPA